VTESADYESGLNQVATIRDRRRGREAGRLSVPPIDWPTDWLRAVLGAVRPSVGLIEWSHSSLWSERRQSANTHAHSPAMTESQKKKPHSRRSPVKLILFHLFTSRPPPPARSVPVTRSFAADEIEATGGDGMAKRCPAAGRAIFESAWKRQADLTTILYKASALRADATDAARKMLRALQHQQRRL